MSNEDESFRTRARSINSEGELSWGGDEEDDTNESWNDAIEESNGITVTEDGTVETGAEVPDAVVYHWPMGGGSGDMITEKINSADGKIYAPQWVSGDWHGGFALDSDASGYVETTTLGDFGSTLNTSFAVSFTIQTTDTGDPKTIASVYDTGSTNNIRFEMSLSNDWFGGNNSPTFELKDLDGNGGTVYGPSGALTDGDIYRVVWNIVGGGPGSQSDWELWINGTKQSTTVSQSGTADNFEDFTRAFGFFARMHDGDNLEEYHFDGVLDNFLIYDGLLTEEEIHSDYESQPWY